MDGKQIRGVFIESKSGRQAILAKVVIDCTGDGDVFHWAGEQFDEIKYYIGLNHRLGNVDRINASAPGYKEMNIGEETALPGVHWCNMLGDKEQCATDVLNLSRLQKKYRKEIWESTEELRKTPGYEQVYLLDTASQIGVRNSRILHENSKAYNTVGDVILTYRPIKGLTLQANLYAQAYSYAYNDFREAYSTNALSVSQSYTKSYTTGHQLRMLYTGTYEKTIADNHNFKIMPDGEIITQGLL